MKIKMRRLLCVVLCLLLGLLLCACASDEKLSESEISALRSRYPIVTNNIDKMVMFKEQPYDTFEHVKNKYKGALGVVEATVTGTDGSVLEIAPADGMAKEKLNLVFVTVHIDSVIAKQDGVDLSGDVTLYVGLREDLEDQCDFASGTRLVLEIYQMNSSLDPEKCPKNWGTAVGSAYYLTEGNYLISMCDYTGPAEKNGVTLNAFRSELKNLYR